MKHIVTILIMALVWAGLSSASSHKDRQAEAPAISFAKKVHDFGSIREDGGRVSCEFTFTNTGNRDLVIISAIAGCGCTRPVFDKSPVPPGESSVIKVTYDPKDRPGEFNKNVTVKTNDPDNKRVILKITGAVVPAN